MLSYLRHLFLPHHTNNYRAKVLHIDFFAIYLTIFLISGLLLRTLYHTSPDILGFATNINVNKLVETTNKKRSEAGVGEVKLNAQLSQAAAQKAADMFGNDYWAHNSPQGKTPWDFIHGAGYVYVAAGENLAKNFNDSDAVVEAWMNSPTHKENLLRSQYEDVGFAIINGKLNGEDTTLVVQMFGKALSQENVPVSTADANTNSIVAAVSANETEVVPSAVPVATPIAPIAQIMPLPSPSPIAALTNSSNALFLGEALAVIKNPLFDIGSLTKNATLLFTALLIITLVVDTVYIWRRKIVRVGGRTSAHLFFLFGLCMLVYLMKFGSIL